MFLFQEYINSFHKYYEDSKNVELNEGDTKDNIKHKPQSRTTILLVSHVLLEAIQKSCSLSSLEKRFKDNIVFKSFI